MVQARVLQMYISNLIMKTVMNSTFCLLEKKQTNYQPRHKAFCWVNPTSSEIIFIGASKYVAKGILSCKAVMNSIVCLLEKKKTNCELLHHYTKPSLSEA